MVYFVIYKLQLYHYFKGFIAIKKTTYIGLVSTFFLLIIYIRKNPKNSYKKQYLIENSAQ